MKLVDTLQARNQLMCRLGTKMILNGSITGTYSVYEAELPKGVQCVGRGLISLFSNFSRGNKWTVE